MRQMSGSAYRLHLGGKDGKGRKALHHGTVLFSVDLQALQKYLNPNKKKLESKGIASVASRVMNLNEEYPNINHDNFCREVEKVFQEHYGEVEKETLEYEKLKKENPTINANYERLKSWEWLYGECPEFKYSIDNKFEWGMTEVTYNVVDGVIKEAKVYSDCLLPDFIQAINEEIVSGITYDNKGLTQLEEKLAARGEDSWKTMAHELCQWMKK